MELSVIVPTYNEAPNVAELVRRAEAACTGINAEIVFVDDSRDHTPDVIRETASRSAVPVRLIHRDVPVGGLGGAVIEGVRSSRAVYCLVMDGDLQHPPELIPAILARLRDAAADVVVASRYCGNGGSAGGLANGVRRLVSSSSTLVSRSLFPVRLKDCSDPMTGFFGFRRSAVEVERLKPTGFKILLEMLARHRLRVAEVPFVFGERFAGESKASFKEGVRFIRQLAGLRFGRIASFGVVGGLGAVLNLLIMGVLIMLGVHYVLAAVIAAETTILTNFLMQERMVFQADRATAHPLRRRFLQSFSFNNVDAAARLPLLWVLVEFAGVGSLTAQAGTLVAAFLLRYLYHSRVVYGTAPPATVVGADAVQRPVTGLIGVFRRQPVGLPPA
ncbi:glycosyltransferase [Kocuria turfanensis]|uniref:Dolichol monophosphate mannose synthase n=1 Tax=Kocuria turfanensis TaxID=388357 RepID=A0A512IA90_9MICC|nr:glycosyltransferase [Kocuria turfanensis]GEO94624.1 dolichol monophosphate mannose synthase [Kocuria turfanensis]